MTALTISCKSIKSNVEWFTPKHLTPNGVWLNDTLMYDHTEVTNSFYKEYMHWIKTAYGEGSDEHKAVMPDTSGYIFNMNVGYTGTNYEYRLSKNSYLFKLEYDDYPVTNITLQQAKDYSKWRSDRVFEMMLIVKGKIKPQRPKKGKSYFTIEKFLTHDKYIKLRKHIPIYPIFFIPDTRNWNIIKNLIREKKIKIGKINSSERYQAILSESGVPLINYPYKGKEYQKDGILNILGNVAELIDGNNLCAGGSILNSKEEILKMEVSTCQAADKLIGFRCMSRWVKL